VAPLPGGRVDPDNFTAIARSTGIMEMEIASPMCDVDERELKVQIA
jgi:hypothetical protein